MRFNVMFACAFALALTPGCKGIAGDTKSNQASSLERIDLKVVTAAGAVHKFNVEVASTPDEQARGLMFRESLPQNGGMLFPMNPPRMAGFWMKNTVISLDMIFIRKDGTIARIARDTVPYSLNQEESGEPIAAVFEISGGRAAQLGIQENDKVSW
jgi:uncharacterized protein